MLLALLILVFALCLYQIRFDFKGYNDKYLSKASTDSIRGLFILLIVLSHSLPYIANQGYGFHRFGDSFVVWFFAHLSQLVVVMFLFYSGYGVSESYKSKGVEYVNAMPRHRLLATLLNFDVAVICYMLLCLSLGKSLTVSQSLLSLIAWDSVGNSNWYIFVILLCYLLAYATLNLRTDNSRVRVLFLSCLCLFSVLILSKYKEDWWYNTLLCFPAGFAFSTYKNKIESSFKRHYLPLLILLFALFIMLYHLSTDRYGLIYNMMGIAFALLFVMLSMKVDMNNKPLQWLGRHLFPIYIYMRLPMILMDCKTPAIVIHYPALFVTLSFIVTIIIARYYKHWKIAL